MSFRNGIHKAIGLIGAMVMVLSLQTAVAASADEYVKEAREYLAEGEVRSAIIQLKNALQLDPTHVQARVILGTLHLRGNDAEAAAKEFERARDLGAAKSQWLPGYAQALMLQGQFQAVLDEVQVDEGLTEAQRADLLALRGNAHLALRQMQGAAADFDAALALAKAHALASLGKARILLAEGKDTEALEGLDQVLTDHPGHVETLLTRGDLLRRVQRLDDAAADYTRAAEVSPANPRAHIGLALVHVAQRDIAAAKQDLAVLNRLTTDLPAVNYLQALVSFQEGHFDRASEELQVLLRVAPSNLQAQLLYGIVSYARSEFTIADDYLTRVFAAVPGNPQVVKLLGAARLKLRQPERAVQVLASAVNDETRDAQLLALLGTAYIQSGDNTRGSQFIERAVELDPDQALLRTQLAVGKIAAGDTSGAISQLESAVALGQDVLQADVLLVLSYLNKKEFDKAIEASEALERRMVDSPIPYNLTGLAFLAQRKFDQAQTRFEQALDKDPEFQVARMNLARLALVAGRPEDAAQAYDDVLAQDPKHLGALMGMAALARARDDDEAERWLLRANQANPDALQPILVLAEGYLRRNEGLKANNILSGLPAEHRESPAVLRLKGMAQLQSGDYPSATFTLKKLTEQQPASVEGWFQLARAQAASGDAEGSRASFGRAIELDAAHEVPVVWIGLGELELREGRFDAALDVAGKIKTHFPDNVYGLDIEAAALRGKGQVEQALVAADAALRLESSSRRVNNFAGQLAAAGQTERAVTVLREWLKDNSQDGASWANLGMLHQQSGQETAALEAYEKAIGHTEDANPAILNNMAWLYLERDGRRALELATRAYELAPSRAEIVDTYGWVLFRQGRKSDGLAALQQALVIAPRNAEIALHVAEALHAMQRDAEARPMLERVLREHPNSGFAESARRLLDRLRG